MTVIAFDGRTVVGDGLVSTADGYIACEDMEKCRRTRVGIVGLAGTPYDLDPLCTWLEADPQGDCPSFDEEHFQGLLVDDAGTPWSINHLGRRAREKVPCAVGSGSDLAIGLMLAGKTAEEAVAIVCQHHSDCGGKLQVLHLNG